MNKYVIVEGIGRRDNREVYKYKNKESGTIVAVRSLLLQSEGDFGVPWPTIRKISLLKEIQHPNVASLVDIVYNQSRTRVHLMLEYADMDLRKFMKTNPARAIDRRFIRSILMQILQGVHCYHSINMAHGKLNPLNVIINCTNFTAKITDLDLMISPSYKAPELLCESFGSGVEISLASDMFSIGCIFAEMLMRRPPFDVQSKYHEIVSISRLVGDVEGRNNKAPNEEINRPAEAKKRSINLTKGTTETDKIIQNLEILIPDFKTAGIDLLSRMLNPDPRRRITVGEALNHAYFKSGVQIK